MKKIVLLLFSVLLCGATFAQKTVWVSDYAGDNLAAKLTAAQVGCTTENPCVLLINSDFPKLAGEILPEKCAGCTRIDYRLLALPIGTTAGTLAAGDDSRIGAGGAVDSVFGRTGVITAAQDDYSWTLISSKPSVFPPDTHGHAISDTTGLQTALDGKSATGHGHAISDTTDLQNTLDGKQPTGSYALTTTPGTSGTAPNWAAGVLNIPTAVTASVTAGLISKTQYDLLNGKQNALGFTPENSANKNAANGYAPLDGSSEVPAANLRTANKTITKSASIFLPTTADTNKIQFYWPAAVTLQRIACSTDAGTTVSINLDERAEPTPNTAGTNTLASALVCDADSQTTTSFADSGIAANVPHNLQITATSGTPGIVRIHVRAGVN